MAESNGEMERTGKRLRVAPLSVLAAALVGACAGDGDRDEVADKPPTWIPSVGALSIARSVVLFAVPAVAEIAGACLVWQAVREGQG